MHLIAADIGNSSTKIGVAHLSDDRTSSDGHWTSRITLENKHPADLDQTELEFPNQPALWAVSSVNSPRAQELEIWVKQNRPADQFHLITEAEVKIESDVQSRTQLGRDRLIAAWMAVELNKRVGPIIVIDAGTAVTIDLVDEGLIFQGGHIFPGADSNFQQLAQNTDALPSLTRELRSKLVKSLDFGTVGKSTDEAIFNGVYQSQIGGIIVTVEAISRKLTSDPVLYITGGGIEDISEFLPKQWNRVSDLVLRGAMCIGLQLV